MSELTGSIVRMPQRATSAARALRSRREPFWKLRAEPPKLRAEPPCKTAIFVCDGVRWTLPTDADPVVPCINRKRQNLTESFSGDKSSLARTPTSRAWLCETSAASEDRSSPMVSIASPGRDCSTASLCNQVQS